MMGIVEVVGIKRDATQDDFDVVRSWVAERRTFLENRGFTVFVRYIETTVQVG